MKQKNKNVTKPKIFELSGLEEAKRVFSPMPEIYKFYITNLGNKLWRAQIDNFCMEINAVAIYEVIVALMARIDDKADFEYTKVQLEENTYEVQLIKKDKKKNIETVGAGINQYLSDIAYGKDTQTWEDLPTPEPVEERKAPNTYAYKLFMLCDMQAETKEPQPYLAAWQALNLIRLLLDKNSKGTFVKFSKSDIQDTSPYFCSSDEGSCVANDLLTEVIAKHVLSCMHILDVADIKHALTYTRERDLDA